MRVLITRPREDAEETAAKLVACGHTALVAPLIEIRFLDGPEISLEGIQAVLATSSNGVQALARRTKRRDVPLFAVGAQTARAARDAGFARVKSADGDARTLAAATVEWAKPTAGGLLHAAGIETKGQLAESLSAQGFHIRTCELYDAVAVNTLPQEVLNALNAGALDAVLLFSPRSARIFSECVVKAGAAGRCRSLMALCISHAAANALSPLNFQAVRIARRPDQTALLAILG
ncbi:MAG: uroporphyrinogen-III synthase [Rhizomicrobium sp.]